MNINLRTLSVSDVMARTGFSRDRVYRLVRAGKLARLRTGPRGRHRILETSLETYFAQTTEGPIARAPVSPHLRQVETDAAVLPDAPRAFA